MDNLPDIIRVFQNVKVNPYIVQTAAELDDVDFPPEAVTVLVSAKTMASSFAVLSAYPRLCLVSHHEGNLYVLDHGRGNRPEVFSEEYVVSRLVRRAMPRRIRLRERQTQPRPPAIRFDAARSGPPAATSCRGASVPRRRAAGPIPRRSPASPWGSFRAASPM